MLEKISSCTKLGVFILLLFSFKTIAQEVQIECNSGASNYYSSGSPQSISSSCFQDLSVEEIAGLPIATLAIDFHFVKSNSNNFQWGTPAGPYYAPTYVKQILDYANYLAANPEKNEFGTSPDLIDTRIRYKLVGDPVNPCDAIFIHEVTPTIFPNPNAFHIIIKDNGEQNVGGITGSATTMTLNNIHYFIFEIGWNDASIWGNVIHHEFGHVFGLYHAFSALNDIGDMNPVEECGGPGGTTCGADPCPSVAPGSAHPECGDNDCFNCYCTWGTGNNFMGYTDPQIGVTRLQWAQMYGSIYTSHPKFVNIGGSCAVRTFDPLIIPAGQFVEWDWFKLLDQPLIVETGATLVIRCEVRVSEELTILVKRGARLFLEGGKITSGSSECKWNGIYVLGNTSLPQPDIADAQNYFATIPPNGAGVVWINGGIIENAVTGIHTLGFGTEYSQTTFGGLVMVNSSDFINNGRAIEFMRYNLPNKSYLNDVDIKLSGTPPWEVNRGVSIWACSNIKFEDVRFEGISEYDIYGINFTAQVKHCTFKNLETNNFTQRYGFRSENTAPNIQPNSSTVIEDSDFELIKYDVYCSSSANMIYPLTIKNNRFKNKPSAGLHAIRIGGEAKYTIGAGNEFNDKNFGIEVIGTGSLLNNIDCNFFGELETVLLAVVATGNNDGLEITGNDFLENTNNEITLVAGSSIHETQGKLAADADNCYFNPVNAIRTPVTAAPFRYYVFDLNGNPVICEKPTNNISDGGTNNYELANSQTEALDCDYSRPEVTPGDLVPARQNTYSKKALWESDIQNEGKYLDYLAAKDWQAYVLRTLLQQAAAVDDLNSAEYYLLGENTNQARREVVGIRFSRENINGAQTLLNSMVDENQEDAWFKDIMAINFAIEQSTDPANYQLTTAQYSQLQTIVDEPASIMRGYACALLSFCTGYACEDPLPEEFVMPEERSSSDLLDKVASVKIFPNPNDGNWSIQCPSLLGQELTCQLLTPEGKLIKAHNFINTGNHLMREDALPNGIYLMKLSQEGNVIFQGRMAILR